MDALLRNICAAWKAVFRRREWECRSERLDRGELIWIRQQHERMAREDRYPFL
jgi:hypothetical protein